MSFVCWVFKEHMIFIQLINILWRPFFVHLSLDMCFHDFSQDDHRFFSNSQTVSRFWMRLVLMLPHRLVFLLNLYCYFKFSCCNIFGWLLLHWNFSQLSTAPKGRIATKQSEDVGRYVTEFLLLLHLGYSDVEFSRAMLPRHVLLDYIGSLGLQFWMVKNVLIWFSLPMETRCRFCYYLQFFMAIGIIGLLAKRLVVLNFDSIE